MTQSFKITSRGDQAWRNVSIYEIINAIIDSEMIFTLLKI